MSTRPSPVPAYGPAPEARSGSPATAARGRSARSSAGGIGPARSFQERSSRRSCTRFPSQAGTGPVRALRARDSAPRFARFPSAAGIGPVRSLLPRSSQRRRAKLPNAGGSGAGQAVVAEIQSHDPAGGVGGHAVPLAQRRRRLPAGAFRPARAAGRVVDRLERRPVRRGAVLRRRGGREDGRGHHDRQRGDARPPRIQRGTGRPSRSGSSGRTSSSHARRGIGSPTRP